MKNRVIANLSLGDILSLFLGNCGKHCPNKFQCLGALKDFKMTSTVQFPQSDSVQIIFLK